MKFDKGWFWKRIAYLIYKAISLAFVTWCLVFVAYYVNKQPIDLNFLLFTAGLVGIKVFKEVSKDASTRFEK